MSNFPAIQDPGGSVQGLQAAVRQLTQAVQMMSGQTPGNNAMQDLIRGVMTEPLNSAVTVLNGAIASLVSRVNDNAAAITTEETTRADADSALSSDITTVVAQVDNVSASGSIRFTSAASLITGASAAFDIQVSATGPTGTYVSSGMQLVAMSDGTSRIVFTASDIIFNAPGVSGTTLELDGGWVKANSLHANKIEAGTITATEVDASSELISGSVQIGGDVIVTGHIVNNAITNSGYASGSSSASVTLTGVLSTSSIIVNGGYSTQNAFVVPTAVVVDVYVNGSLTNTYTTNSCVDGSSHYRPLPQPVFLIIANPGTSSVTVTLSTNDSGGSVELQVIELKK